MSAMQSANRKRTSKPASVETYTRFCLVGSDRSAMKWFDDHADAEDAAQELAEENPGQWFCLYQSVGEGQYNVPVMLYGVCDEQLISPLHTPTYTGVQRVPLG